MSGQEKWMQNPYIIPGVPSLSPIHLKRHSESASAHGFPCPSGSSKRPSTSSSSSPNTLGTSSSGATTAAARVKYPYTVLTRGKKHHAYTREIAPYPLNYESRLLDYDALDTTSSSFRSPSLVHQIVLSDRTTHPRRVLDVGCGNGSWCINAASLWPDTSFVGLDLVAIQPDPYALERIASLKGSKSRTKLPPQPHPRVSVSSSASQSSLPPTSIYNRIKWVHHNFLTKRLPFKDNEFDLVRIRGIAQGIPEDEWTNLFGDLTRVLSPGGWLEIIEEDIIFPVVIAPTVTFGRTSKSARQNALKSHTAQQALNKQSLLYSEETRPSAFLSSPAHDGNWSSAGAGYSPLSPVDPLSRYTDKGGGAPSPPSTAGIYNIPSSYLQYAQTVPSLARSLPPLTVINPFINQMHFINHGETRPFAQDHAVLEQLFNAVFTKRWINLEPTAILGAVLGMEVGLSRVVASECLEIARPVGPRGAAGTERSDSLAAEGGRRRGSGGTTLLEDAVIEVDEAMRSKGGEREDAIDLGDDTNIPPRIRAALSSSYDSLISPGQSRDDGRQKANISTTTQSGGIRKYPSLALTASLHLMFPSLDHDIVRAFHLQRAWENVVACKEAMWEEFLTDSAVRDKEAHAATIHSPISQNAVASSSSSFVSAMGSIGGMSSVSAVSKMPSTQAGMGLGLSWGHRRAPTLLDELEWADSDQRRSERERFDILLDRYEMRIRRYCASIFQTSSISSFVPRDRQGWGDADPDSSSDDDIDFDEPEEAPMSGNTSSVGSPSVLEIPSLPRLVSEPSPSLSGSDARVEESEENSSADEVTLVEPQSPHSRHSISSLAPTRSQDSPPPPPGASLTVPTTPMLAKLKLNAEALRLNTSPDAMNATPTPTERGKGRRKGRSSAGKQAKDDSEAMPCRIVRAFIATKTMPTSQTSTLA